MGLTPGQKACVETLDAPVAVSAGAGSGKTFTLTRRIVHAIESGVAESIDDVLAITFTSKAAGEIKARVKSALSAAGRAEDARAVDGAWISTIHGMCARILHEHAVELGLDPAFTVIEGVDADRLRDAAIDEALASANDMVSPQGLDALFAEYPARATGAFGGGTIEDMLKTIIDAASANPRGLDAVEEGPAPQSGVKLLARVADDARALVELAEAEKDSKSRTKFLDAAAASLEAADAALAAPTAPTDLECARLIAQFPYPATNFGAKGGAYRTFAEQARAIEAAGCDLVIVETMSDLREAKAAPFAVFDELGGEALADAGYYEALVALLFAATPIVGVLRERPHGEGAELYSLLGRDPDTLILPTTGSYDINAAGALRHWTRDWALGGTF